MFWSTGTGLTVAVVLAMFSGVRSQTCVLTDDCIDSGTTCQDVRIPAKRGTTYSSTTEKRCICSEALRQPCFDDGDCTARWPGLTGLKCFVSNLCPGQTSVGYCRLDGVFNDVDLRSEKEIKAFTINGGMLRRKQDVIFL